MEENSFKKGIKDGMPICLGYLGVSFAFGIFAVASGLKILEAFFLSVANLTSAGQFAAVPVIMGGGSIFELALGQIVINLRYSFMGVSLSQKFGKSIRSIDRYIIAFANTDEIFAVAVSQRKSVGKKYMYGLALTPFLGWSFGTLLGAVLGNVLPAGIVSALGIALYAMFIAIVLPQMKSDKNVLICVLLSILLSCAFYYIDFLKKIPQGFAVIICAVTASTIFALWAPIKETEDSENEI